MKRSRDFYGNIPGLADGYRSPFASVGHWLYMEERLVVHLVQRRADDAAGVTGGGAIHHIAFRGTDLAGMRTRLDAAGVHYTVEVVPRDGAIQLFLFDPDGIRIELNYAPS